MWTYVLRKSCCFCLQLQLPAIGKQFSAVPSGYHPRQAPRRHATTRAPPAVARCNGAMRAEARRRAGPRIILFFFFLTGKETDRVRSGGEGQGSSAAESSLAVTHEPATLCGAGTLKSAVQSAQVPNKASRLPSSAALWQLHTTATPIPMWQCNAREML